MRPPAKHLFEFDPFRLDPVERLLYRDGEVVPLTAKVFDILLVFVQNSGRTLEKEEVMRQVWADQFIEEGNLTRNVSTLRKALGESPDEHRYIVTIPGRGYRFVAEVRQVGNDGLDPMVNGKVASPIADEEKGESNEAADAQPARRTWRKASFAVGVALLCLAAAWIYLGLSRKAERAARVSIKSIAVLPFKPLVAEQRDEAQELGMADTLISKLGNLRQIVVRPLSSVRKYNLLGQDPVAAGREQKVEVVLDGSIQRSDERLRVTVRLISMSDGATLWSDKFDVKPADVFTVQDSISERVAEELTLQLSSEEKKLLTGRYTENFEAYQLYLKGRYRWSRLDELSLRRGIEYFNQAIEKDPNFARPYSGLASCYTDLGFIGKIFPKEAWARGKAAVIKALELDETLGDAHALLAGLKMYDERDWAGAERECQRAIELNPGNTLAHLGYANYWLSQGRPDEAIARAKRAQELDPLSPMVNLTVAYAYYLARRHDQAIEQCHTVLEMNPKFGLAHGLIGEAYEQKGIYRAAMAEFGQARKLLGGGKEMLDALGHAYAASGDRASAMKILDELKKLAQREYVSSYDIARIYVGLGNQNQAFAWLEKAETERAGMMIYIKTEPRFDRLRSDPRFANLLRRVGLAP